jgi:hypothetical protein
MAELTDEHREILDFERAWWKYAGAKEAAIRDRFGMTATRYYQVLNCLLDDAQAEAYAPMTVRRLRRLRDQRAAFRAARRNGFQAAT